MVTIKDEGGRRLNAMHLSKSMTVAHSGGVTRFKGPKWRCFEKSKRLFC